MWGQCPLTQNINILNTGIAIGAVLYCDNGLVQYNLI